MKNLVATALLLALGLTAISQKITNDKVPGTVGKAFRAKFPAAQQDSWTMVGNNYEAVFFNAKARQSARFSSMGTWLQTETEWQVKDLPRPVMQTVNKQFSGFQVQEAYRLETPTGISYEVVVFKGAENYLLQITEKGDLTAKEAGE